MLKTALRLAGPRPSVGPIDPPSMLAVDPELLDGLQRDAAAGGTVDVVARYAGLLPVTVISEMLGVPVGMREQFLAWGDGATPSRDIGGLRRSFGLRRPAAERP